MATESKEIKKKVSAKRLWGVPQRAAESHDDLEDFHEGDGQFHKGL